MFYRRVLELSFMVGWIKKEQKQEFQKGRFLKSHESRHKVNLFRFVYGFVWAGKFLIPARY